MISRILVPVDGSETARRCVEYSIEFARQINAAITFLSVIDTSAFVTKTIPAVVTPTHLIEPLEDYMRQAAEAYIHEAETLCKEKGVKSETVIRTGHPVEGIIQEAKRSKVDLIVIGSHGRSALEAAVLGSVTFGVIHKDTRFPVLIVRG